LSSNNSYSNSNSYNQPQAQSYSQPSQPQSYNQPSQSQSGGSNDLLDQCFTLDNTITELESRLSAFRALQSRVLSDKASFPELDAEAADILTGYRALASRMKKIKSKPESGNPRNAAQVGRVDRRLKASMTEFQKVESEFRQRVKEQQARQYRIVKPDASEEEVAAAVESPDSQIFQQALINSDRRGQAQSTMNAVRQRHQAIQNIERTMIELAELFQDLDTLVLQQDVQVKEIEQKAEEAAEDVTQANVELDKGISSARAARKKKWCLLIFLIIVIVVVVAAVVIYFEINKAKPATTTNNTTTNNNNNGGAAGNAGGANHKHRRMVEYWA
jgi:syntaxin 1B/2/3